MQIGDEALLVLEAVEIVERTLDHWRQMGRALAHIHSVKGERFGFETHAYWGSLLQGNTPLAEWVDFFHYKHMSDPAAVAGDSKTAVRMSQGCSGLPTWTTPRHANDRQGLERLCRYGRVARWRWSVCHERRTAASPGG